MHLTGVHTAAQPLCSQRPGQGFATHAWNKDAAAAEQRAACNSCGALSQLPCCAATARRRHADTRSTLCCAPPHRGCRELELGCRPNMDIQHGQCTSLDRTRRCPGCEPRAWRWCCPRRSLSYMFELHACAPPGTDGIVTAHDRSSVNFDVPGIYGDALMHRAGDMERRSLQNHRRCLGVPLRRVSRFWPVTGYSVRL